MAGWMLIGSEEPFMDTIGALLARWHLTTAAVRDRVYRAVSPRERERWHALWLLAQGWSEAKVATALDRDPHTIGLWVAAFRTVGPVGLSFEQTGGPPPP
jgi:hypothetical protein